MVIYRLVCLGLEWVLRPAARLRWAGRLPSSGGLLLAPNHVSVLDPLLLGAAAVRAGRIPRFVGTAGVFRIPVIGAVLRYFDHLPLDRAAASDGSRLEPVRRAVLAGECVVLYPEGRVTRDVGYRPGRFHRGIVRLAAETGAPIVPVGQWGAQWLVGRPRPAWLCWPPRRAQVRVRFGEPLVVDGTARGPADGSTAAELLRDQVEQIVRQLAGGRPCWGAEPDVGGTGEEAHDE